tara:strand:- start:34 stop:285 length:252 start_codon:yes stop_codon:yes gene_type:complete
MNKSEAVKKGVEAMKGSENNVAKEEKVLKASDIRSLVENLTIQYNQFNQLVNENQTKMLETRGAIAVATAQLQGLENDTKPAD